MKVTASDVVQIMRRFDLADEKTLAKEIKNLRRTNPQPTNLLVSFELSKKNYALLFDDSLQDSENGIKAIVAGVHPGTDIQILLNPLEKSAHFGMPFRGKDCYLAVINDHTTRLDAWLAAEHPEYSRASWQHFIKQGYIKINNTSLRPKPNQKISSDDQIDISLPEDRSGQTLDVPIVYIDEDVVVINKPAGILSHPKNERDEEETVQSFMSRYIDETVGDEQRYGIVHRLDRDTSGVMICARNLNSYQMLKQQFANRMVEKTYIAVTSRIPKPATADIDIPIARSLSKPGTFVCSHSGKPALTRYQVLRAGKKRALVELKPTTGRTHQLRVHMQHIGTPILGDRLYGGKQRPLPRLYLHATKLNLKLPSGTEQAFEAPYPKEFETAVDDDK